MKTISPGHATISGNHSKRMKNRYFRVPHITMKPLIKSIRSIFTETLLLLFCESSADVHD